MEQSYPLVFKFEDIVSGNGFVCRILAQGRALLVEESDGFWVYGVTPGGVAAGGAERSEALGAFKKAYLSVLFDIAADKSDPVELEAQVKSFFDESCSDLLEPWQEARVRVQAGELKLDSFASVAADGVPPQVSIWISDRPTAEANPQHEDEFFLPRAA